MATLNNWQSNWASNGWNNSTQLYIYLCDEPSGAPGGPSGGEGNPILSCTTQGIANHGSTPPTRNLITTQLDVASYAGTPTLNAIDIMVPIINELDPQGGTLQLSAYDAWRASPNPDGIARQVFSYEACSSAATCGGPPGGNNATWPEMDVDAVPAANRAMEWMTFLHGQTGELYYLIDGGMTNSWDNFFSFGENGAGRLVYTGSTNPTFANYVGTAKPIYLPSLRLKMLRDGMQDYEYMNVLAKAGQGAFVQSTIASWIKNSYTFNENATTPTGSFTSDLTDARQALGSKIHQLTYGSSSGGPVISNVTVDNVTRTTARIQWNTDVPSSGLRVIYDSLQAAPPFANSTQIKTGTANTIQGYTLGGLAPSTLYNFQACSTANGVESCSPTGQFTIAAAGTSSIPVLPISPLLPPMPVINGTTSARVASDCSDFQSILNQAAAITGSANHQILIAPGTQCIGGYSLPPRAGTGWIVVRSAAPDSQLPPEGVRVTTTTYPAVMPVISALANYQNALGSAIYATSPTSNWRFVGLQFTAQPGVHESLIWLTQGSASHMIFDRDIFNSVNTSLMGIIANGNQTVIANCSITTINTGTNAVAIEMSMAQGLTIDNNYIDAPGISVFSEEDGIAGASGAEASDISITHNFFQWDKTYINNSITRQQLEFKAGRRILIDGNIFSSEWTTGQTGSFTNAMIFTPRNGVAQADFNNQIADVTITNNLIYDVPGGINVYGSQNTIVVTDVPAAQRFLIRNNLLYDISGFKGATGRSVWGSPFFFGEAIEDIVVDHNTAFDARGNGPWMLEWQGNPGAGLKLTNNILGQNYTNNFGGIAWSEDTSEVLPAPITDPTSPVPSFQGFIHASPKPDPTLSVIGNLIIPGVTDTTSNANYDNSALSYTPATCVSYWSALPGNQCAGLGSATANQVFASVKFVGPLTTGSGFQLAAGSAYKNSASDGTDPGVDWPSLHAATLHTLDGAWGGASPSPGCPGGLPVPGLNLPAFLPVNATISASIPSGCSVDHFVWTFTPASGPQVSGTLAKSFSASSTVATLATPVGSVNFSQAALTLGTYLISVQSADSFGNSSQASAPVQVTLVWQISPR